MTVTAIYCILNRGDSKLDSSYLQDRTTMAPTRTEFPCCPTCPRELSTSSGRNRHRRYCDEYQIYSGARRTLHQQIIDGNFTSNTSTIASSHHSPQTPGRQLERDLDPVQSLEDDIVSPFFIIGHQRQKSLTRVGTVVFLRPRSNQRSSHDRGLPSESDGAPSQSITYSSQSQAISTSDSTLPPATIGAYIATSALISVKKTTAHAPIASTLSRHLS
jgi:hypothetical protein